MTFLEIPRRRDDIKEPWWAVVEIDGVPTVYIACPNCGGGMTLTNYKVLDDGTVKAIGGSNSVSCSTCIHHKLKKRWHHTVRLLDWDPGLLE